MLREFLFPADCLHCQASLKSGAHFLCASCADLLPWIDGISRCPRCFFSNCSCARLHSPLYRKCAVFSYEGPAEVLIHQYKFQGLQQLTELFVSCLLLQIEKANLGAFDLIVPVPHAPWHSFFRNYNTTELLAASLSKKMKTPWTKGLKRSWATIPQRCKTKTDRKSSAYDVRSCAVSKIVDRHVLLIDDVSTTGTTLVRCAEALKECFAARVSACTLAIVDPD